jgi:hypothetical protein
MSLELILVFALTAPPSSDRLQSALDRKEIPIRFSQSEQLNKHTGFLPLKYVAEKSGFYVTQLTYEELTSDYPKAKLPSGGGTSVIALQFGGQFLECASVFQVAAVLVSDFGAQAFDTESDGYMSLEDIGRTAEECYKESRKNHGSR